MPKSNTKNSIKKAPYQTTKPDPQSLKVLPETPTCIINLPSPPEPKLFKEVPAIEDSGCQYEEEFNAKYVLKFTARFFKNLEILQMKHDRFGRLPEKNDSYDSKLHQLIDDFKQATSFWYEPDYITIPSACLGEDRITDFTFDKKYYPNDENLNYKTLALLSSNICFGIIPILSEMCNNIITREEYNELNVTITGFDDNDITFLASFDKHPVLSKRSCKIGSVIANVDELIEFFNKIYRYDCEDDDYEKYAQFFEEYQQCKSKFYCTADKSEDDDPRMFSLIKKESWRFENDDDHHKLGYIKLCDKMLDLQKRVCALVDTKTYVVESVDLTNEMFMNFLATNHHAFHKIINYNKL